MGMTQSIYETYYQAPLITYTNMPVRFDKVSDEIYRGGAPSATDLSILSDIFNVNTVISLDGNIGGAISPIVKSLDINHIIIPISGEGSISLIKYLHNNIVNLLNNNQPVYVHCRHGSDRTGMAVALYRIQNDGWNPVDALKEAKVFNFGDKLDANTEALYRNVVFGKQFEDINESDDIVSQMRDWFDMGRVPPAYLPQQSFAPKDDIKVAPPNIEEHIPPSFKDPTAFSNYMSSGDDSFDQSNDRKDKMRAILLEMLGEEDAEKIPLSGQYDNYSGMRGVGPVETGSFLNL